MPSQTLVSAERELIADIGGFSRDPLGYVWYAFPWETLGEEAPREWQCDVLETIGKHLNSAKRHQPLQLAIASGHGIGKSALIAMVCNWAMSTCEDCRVVVTANTEDQLRTKTWPEITKWFGLAINTHWWQIGATTVNVKEKDHSAAWRVDRVTWSENNTEAFAGLHNKGKRIVVIYDEGSTIADSIWEVTQGALTDEDTEIIWLAFGNPTRNTGRFRECFGRYKHRWITKQIDSRTVPGTNKQLIDSWITDYGEDSDYVRVRVRGEFPRAGSTQFIAGDVVSAARHREVSGQERLYKVLSVDVARFGDDQTVIGMRQGLKFRIMAKLRGLDTTQVASRVMEIIRDEEPRACVVDGDGIGGGVVDYINFHLADWMEKRKDWFRLHEFHGGATPSDGFMYFNRRAEVWGLMRNWLETGAIPDDPELEADLTGPEYFFSSKNQIQLERKDDMKKRGLASPDCGDTLAMTFAADVVRQTYQEALAVKIDACIDPMQQHFLRLAETERRKKAAEPLPYWS